MKLTPCPECGGQRIPCECSDVMFITSDREHFAHLDALVCTKCGYTAFFAEPLTEVFIAKHREQGNERLERPS